MELNIKSILGFLIIIFIIGFIAYYILYNIGKQFCDKEKEVPFRYQESGGLFSKLIKVETTEDKKDGYIKICVDGHNPNFLDISETIRYVAEKSRAGG